MGNLLPFQPCIRLILSIMKVFVTLLAVVALASAQDNCQRCGEAVQQLGEYLLTPSEIAAVEQGLVDLVCTTLPEENIEGCAVAVYKWWPQIAEALFKYQGTVIAICVGIGACETRNPLINNEKFTCDECLGFLDKVSGLLATEDFANVVAADLHGDVFCGNPDYIQPADVETCQNFMDLVAVKAVGALSVLLKASAEKICTENGCT